MVYLSKLYSKELSQIFCFCLLMFVAGNLQASSEDVVANSKLYWIGGTGDWDDSNHWSKNSGGTPSGYIPEQGFDAIFDSNSGLTGSSTVYIPAGDNEVNDIIVTTTASFDMTFEGASGNMASMNVYGDLSLSSSMSVTYVSASIYHNEWNFTGESVHSISTNGQDLLHVNFLEESADYNLSDDLLASLKIRHYGGEWNSNNHEINTEYLHFQDANSSANPLTKVFNAGTSDIYCDTWSSKFAYQSLEVTGTYTIYTQKFEGSPGTELANFAFHNIHLLEYTDMASGGTSQIEHNNFVCTHCTVNEIVIEDTGLTQLAGIFTVENKLEVTNLESTIAFNGGNSYGDEVVINGNVIVPNVSGCSGRTIFTNVYCDFTTFIRSTGTLEIENSIINNIHTQGNANFEISNSALSGSSTGWTESNVPNPLTYVWIGNGAIADWNDPANWELDTGGSNGCLPTIIDHVLINSLATSDIRVPPGFVAECRSFTWKNSSGLELLLDGTAGASSSFEVYGDFSLHPTAIISVYSTQGITFTSNGFSEIKTNGVVLPKLTFEGPLGEWHLEDDLSCSKIHFVSGTLVTDNFDIETDFWWSLGDLLKTYFLGSSHIKVNGEFKLSQYPTSNVTLNQGASLIECEKLVSTITNLYDLKLNNQTTTTLSSYPYVLNDLILNSAFAVSTNNDIELNNIIFMVNGSSLELDPADTFTINGGIESNTNSTSPGALKSKTFGVQASIDKAEGNICVAGNVSFTDINSNLTGVIHAPNGIDDGNNTGINFDDGSSVSHLYWIGGNGYWTNVSNWSRVSGGCPSVKNPDDMDELFFDDNGISANENEITVDGSHFTNKMRFENSELLELIVTGYLETNSALLDGGYVSLENNNMKVHNSFTLQGASILIVDLQNLTIPSLTTTDGLVILKQDTNVQIND